MSYFRIKALLAALFSCAAFSAAPVSAASPFSDVDPSSWAWRAVAGLSEEGAVAGYPDGTFRGARNVSRYEMAQIVGQLMANENSLTAEQKKTVDQLASEYRDELKSLGVRVSELEKKRGNNTLFLEWRISGMDRYDNIYKNNTQKHYELGSRIRLHDIASLNQRTTLYTSIEAYQSLNDRQMYDVHDSHYRNNDENINRNDDFHLSRLFVTQHFGKSKEKHGPVDLGPSNDLFAIGRFPVQMGVTGYTYQGSFTGISLQFGDYVTGGHFTVAYGRANDLNYDYIGPMMKGVRGLRSILAKENPERIDRLQTQIAGVILQRQGILPGDPRFSAALPGAKNQAAASLTQALGSSSSVDEFIGRVSSAMGMSPSDVRAGLSPQLAEAYSFLNGRYEPDNDTLYPMWPQGVHMSNHEDQDVPVVYASYIFRKPHKWEAHAYGLKALGPVGRIAKAYGFAVGWYPVGRWNIHGEYIKNMRKLPLNNERPYSFNWGISYGEADVLRPHSWQFGIDRVYSKAGTYFGGSSNDVADQYMGAVYRNWHGQRMPAYIADVIDDRMNGRSGSRQYGGAKFYLAKAVFVPMKGLLIEADYGFGAKDMGNRKMDDMFRIQATAYIM